MTEDDQFKEGDIVERINSDYTMTAVIVSKFPKLSGVIRYAIEDDRGVLFITSAKWIKLVRKGIK